MRSFVWGRWTFSSHGGERWTIVRHLSLAAGEKQSALPPSQAARIVRAEFLPFEGRNTAVLREICEGLEGPSHTGNERTHAFCVGILVRALEIGRILLLVNERPQAEPPGAPPKTRPLTVQPLQTSKPLKEKRESLEVQIRHKRTGKAYRGRVSIELPDGRTMSANVGDRGVLRIGNLQPGTCRVTLLDDHDEFLDEP